MQSLVSGRAKGCDSSCISVGANVVTQDVLYRTCAHDSCSSRTVHYAPLHFTRVFCWTGPTCHLASVTSWVGHFLSQGSVERVEGAEHIRGVCGSTVSDADVWRTKCMHVVMLRPREGVLCVLGLYLLHAYSIPLQPLVPYKIQRDALVASEVYRWRLSDQNHDDGRGICEGNVRRSIVCPGRCGLNAALWVVFMSLFSFSSQFLSTLYYMPH